MIKPSFQLKTIGSLLKERRRERKLTLPQISEITKIRTEYLKALEDGDYKTFPSEVYIKGFLKNYAKFLGIDTERALAMFRRESSSAKEQPIIQQQSRIAEKKFDFTITPSKILIAVIAAAVLFVLIYIGSYVGNILKQPSLSLSSPIALEAGQEGTYQTDKEELEIIGKVEIGTTLTVNGQKLQTNNFERFSQNFPLQAGENKLVFQAESQFGRKSSLTITVYKQGSTITEGTPTPTVTPTGADDTMNIKVEIVNRDAYLEVTVDSKKELAEVVTVGRTLTFTGKQSLKLFSPRPDALRVIINDQSQTIKGTTNTWTFKDGKISKQ